MSANDDESRNEDEMEQDSYYFFLLGTWVEALSAISLT